MAWQVTPYVAISLAAVILLVTLAIYIFRREDNGKASKTGAILLLASAAWILGGAYEAGSLGLSTKILWDKFQFVGLLIVPTGWVIYIHQYTGGENWLNRRRLVLLSIPPLVFILLVLTNEFHQLIWSSIDLPQLISNSHLIKTSALGFWIIVLHSYLMLGAGTFILGRMLIRSRRIHSWQASVMLLAIFSLGLISLLDIVGLQLNPQVDSTALALAITIPLITWGMWRIKSGDLVSVARGAVIEGMSDAVIVLDAENRIVDLNPAAALIIGRPISQLVGRSVEEGWPAWPTVIGVSGCEDAFGVEADLVVNGDVKTYDIRISPVDDRIGRLACRTLVFRDISRRKQVEKALRESVEKYPLLAEQSTDMIARHDPDGVCLFVSPTCRTLLGYEPEEMIGRRIFGLIHPDDLDEFVEGMNKLLVEPTAKSYTYRLHQKDGDYIWVETSGRRIITSSEDSVGPLEIITVTRDITERKRAEDALAAERERLAVTLRSIGDGVVALDAERRIVVTNPVAEDHLKTLAGVGVGEILSRLGDQHIEALLRPPSRGKNFHEVTVEGPRRCFEVVTQQIETGPQVGGWVMVIRDVTSERETQKRIQLQDRLAAVGQLAAGIAHDFNNILGAIILYSEMLLKRAELSDRDRERMMTIYQQAERAATLTRQILDYSRRTVMDQTPMDLSLFLNETQKLLSRTLPEGIQVKFDHGNENYVVNADPARIQQILMNLAFNARDAMPEGGELCFELSRLLVETDAPPPFRDMAPGAWLQLRVSDTGVGIEPYVQPHIFEPFFTTKSPGEGSGLGLAQVYGIVKQHDGYIDVKSEVGEGTTFIIYLPAIEAPEWSSIEALSSTLIDGQGEAILVVEDNLATQTAVREILETLNYRVVSASDGKEALEIIENYDGAIDLVLSDMVMPVMGGVELYQELIERGLATKVVLMSGYPLGAGTRELLDQKGVTWLQKPMRSDALAQLIREVLENRIV
jgi:two-component system cell cycle sensor histidine kinase/response regulator CckA